MFGVLVLVLVGLVTSLAFPSHIFSAGVFRRETTRENRDIDIMYIFMVWECFHMNPFDRPSGETREENARYYLDTMCTYKEEGYACVRDLYDQFKNDLNAEIRESYNIDLPDLDHSLDAIGNAIFYVCDRKEFIISKVECIAGLGKPRCGPRPGNVLPPTFEAPTPPAVLCNPINSTSKCYGRAARPCGAQLEEIFVDVGEMLFDGCVDDFNQ